MTAFDHVIVLLSFVYALALTHLLSRVGALIEARGRVAWRGSGLMWLMVVNAGLNLIVNWLALLGYRNQTDWNFLDVLLQLAMAITLYFLCYLALPEASDEGEIDLDAYFWKQRRAYYAVALAGLAAAFLVNLDFLKTPLAGQVFVSNASVLVLAVPVVFALTMPERWVQWLCGSTLLAGVVF